MRPALLFLTGWLLGACATNTDATVAPISPSLIGHVVEADDLQSKTVALVVREDDSSLHVFCSGVWVSATLIATANHCVSEDENGDAVSYLIREDVFGAEEALKTVITARSAIKIASDAAHDVALLRANSAPLHVNAQLATSPVRPGMFVQAMGQPLGLWWSYSSGDVAAVRDIESDGVIKGLFVQATTPISPGSSGCGLFDAYGQLVGIAHGSFTRGQGLNLFVHYRYVAELIKKNG